MDSQRIFMILLFKQQCKRSRLPGYGEGFVTVQSY